MPVLEQARQQASRQESTRFQPGVSGNPAGRETKAARQARIDAKARKLARPFGGLGALDIIGRVRLEQAARLLLDKRHRSAEDEVRYANTIERLLASVEARQGRVEAPSGDFSRMLPP